MKQVEIQKITDAYIQPDGTLRYVGSASGMQNLFLTNGYNISPDETCYSINDLSELYTCIAYSIQDYYSDKPPTKDIPFNSDFIHRFLTPYGYPLHWTYEIKDNARIVFTHRENVT